ncbi:MAG TPA: hypothetical protein PLP42_12055, partial [Acidobacteriota bacterium]|nr:hypothetical protein [Acidobacteriota bacterium]
FVASCIETRDASTAVLSRPAPSSGLGRYSYTLHLAAALPAHGGGLIRGIHGSPCFLFRAAKNLLCGREPAL